MKSIRLFLASLMVIGLMTGCGGSGGNNTPGITMTMQADGKVEIALQGDGMVAVDWGDGSPVDSVMLDSKTLYGTHDYSGNSEYTISITGENITTFGDNILKLKSIDVSKSPTLQYLRVSGNPDITSLDVSKNVALLSLNCHSNKLTKLDLSKNTALKELYCDDNQLTSLDLSKNPDMKIVFCDNNKLTKLDVSKSPALDRLICNRNELTSLDVSKNVALDLFYIDHNQLSAQALNALFESLHENDVRNKEIVINNNPGTDASNQSIAANKGWTVK